MEKVTDVLKKPVLSGVLAGIAGIILGLFWAWMVQPVQWINADPSFLSADYQADYLRMAIDSYQVNQNAEAALHRYKSLGANGPVILATINANPGSQKSDAIGAFTKIVEPGGLAAATSTPTGGGTTTAASPTTSGIIIVVIVVVVGVVGYFVLRLMRPLIKKSGEQTPVQQAQQMDRESRKTDFAEMNEEPPIFQMMNTYVVGDDLYTHSMDINSADGTYLGQCGLEIADSIPVFDKPKRVRGIAVWLFGLKYKETTWAILMPPDAYENAALRDRLRVKGEPIKVEPNLVIEIETRELKMHVRIADVEYGQGATADEDYFKRLTLELAVWPKIVAPD
ncbi:MAG: hypothetical protein FD146_1834 [Anaerolineaceae bacterium]|nr:MAG: hypothetical protein FD146_1834 [Anaerolineaceae bacterium]